MENGLEDGTLFPICLPTYSVNICGDWNSWICCASLCSNANLHAHVSLTVVIPDLHSHPKQSFFCLGSEADEGRPRFFSDDNLGRFASGVAPRLIDAWCSMASFWTASRIA